MRRALKVGAGVLIFAAGAAAGFGVSVVVDDDEDDNGSVEFTDVEHDRLVDACVASENGEGSACAVFVDELIAELEPLGCGYSAAVELLDKEMRVPDANSDLRDEWYDEAISDC